MSRPSPVLRPITGARDQRITVRVPAQSQTLNLP